MYTVSFVSLPISILLLILSCNFLQSAYVEARPRSGSMARDLGPDLYERFYGPDGVYAPQIYQRSLPSSEADNSTSQPIPIDITEVDVTIRPLRRSESECTPSVPTVPVQTGAAGPIVVPSSGVGQTNPNPQSGLSNAAMIEARVPVLIVVWSIFIALFSTF